MSTVWAEILGGLATAVAIGVISLLVMRPALKMLLAPILTRFVNDSYEDNLFGTLTVMRHVGGQTFGETMMRASQGVPLSRPMGSPLTLSPWDQLLLQPVYLTPRLPTRDESEIETRTVIGPRAERPLECAIPILIAGMSYGGALSVKAKLALAKGANQAGTATNSGESYLPEERQAAERLIVQHHRGLWANSTMNRPELLDSADAIEIQLGQGAQAAAAMRTPANLINKKMRGVYGLSEGEEERLSSRFADVASGADFVRYVRELKGRTAVPVGVKVGVSAYVERELDIFLEAGVDFVTLDGAEGGTHGGPPTLQDDVGLPTLYAIARADAYLRQVGARDRVTLIAAGQLTTPGRFLKAMALGADAVYIGTVALIAMLTSQMKKTLPWEPPSDLIMEADGGTFERAFDVDEGAGNLARYLESTMGDIRYTLQALGRGNVHELSREDLVALTSDLASAVGVPTAWSVLGADREAFERLIASESRERTGAAGSRAHKAAQPERRG
jgi:methylamine---glutamate N-methyltransferase subunit C